MRDDGDVPIGGAGKVVEADETFFGHKKGFPKKPGVGHKMAIVSLVERDGGKLKSVVIDSVSRPDVEKIVKANVHKESQLMTESPTMLPFQMAAIPGGGMLVAGSTSRRLLWFSRIAKGGEKQWAQEHFEPGALWQGVWNYQVLASAQESVVVFTELVVGEEKEQRQIVKVLTLKSK